ncbi:DUF1559 domain-containing protein [Bremerella sp.]|uniref:DUF1559 family PulG-like putative transporter n=1 Tax=Bremerella sp. TaxID=2795602 RepID=UPI00391C2C3B
MITKLRRWKKVQTIRRAFTLVELLVAIAIIGILVGLTLSAVQQARESARRLQCTNNLKQLGLAALLHEETHRHLPTGGWGYRWVAEPHRGLGRNQPGGWIYAILPYLEQKNLHELAARTQTQSEYRDRLAEMIQTPLEVFHCPTRRSAEPYPTQWQAFNAAPTVNVAKTDYAANAGDMFVDVGGGPITLEQGDSKAYVWPQYHATGICFIRSEVRIASIRDGSTNTYMLGEKNVPAFQYESGAGRGDDQSMYSGDDFDTLRWTTLGLTPTNDDSGEHSESRFGSAHSAGCHFVFCDGSVKLINYSIDEQVHQHLGNRSDGEVIEGADF